MKKTIALMVALAGVAAADVTGTIDGHKLNLDLALYLSKDAYTGGDFSLSFKIVEAASFEGQQKFITLSDGYWAHSQLGTYIGLTPSAGTTSPAGWSDGEGGSTLDGGINYFTANGVLNSWISKNSTGAHANPGVSNTTWTFSYDAGTNTSTIELLAAGDCHEVVTLNNYALNLNQFSVLDAEASSAGPRLSQISDAVVTYNGKAHNLMVPEPATATLGLLALAGLAARRKRH